MQKCQGEGHADLFGIILTALRLQSHRSIQLSIGRYVSNPETFLRRPRVTVSGLEGHFAFKVEQFNISEKSLLKSSRFPMASTSCASIALSKLSDA